MMRFENFFLELETLTRFIDAAKLSNYKDVPGDWIVLITDITNSTIAIAEGRYKDVNSCGAAVIAAVRNATGKEKFPFIFGGDGAIMLVPQRFEAVVVESLQKMKYFAEISFGLELRTGYALIAGLRREGFEFKTAKYKFSDYYQQALFRGSGFEEVERQLKEGDDSTCFKLIREKIEEIPDLTGFECRWNSIPSHKGLTLALLVKAKVRGERENEIFDTIIGEIFNIYGTENDFNPIQSQNLNLVFSYKKLKNEILVRGGKGFSKLRYYFKLIWLNIAGALFFNGVLGKKGSHWSRYKEDVKKNVDYIKMDDMIRMVIASSEEQKDRLLGTLDEFSRKGLICYGIHITDSALLTCIVDKYEDEHFHLIDASDGGYALAAKQLKEKLRAGSVEL